jgi:hypothetical protein
MHHNSSSLREANRLSTHQYPGKSGACETHTHKGSAPQLNRQQRRRQDQIDQRELKNHKARQQRDTHPLGLMQLAGQLIEQVCATLPEPASSDERFHAGLSGDQDAGQAVAPPSWFDPVSSAWTWVASGVDSALKTLDWPQPVGAQSTCSVDGTCTNTVQASKRRTVRELVSEAKAAGWIVEMSPQMKERLARDPQCSLVDTVVMIPNGQHLDPEVNAKTLQLIQGYFVPGDASTGTLGDIVAVELDDQCVTASGIKLFGDACVSIDDAELRAVIEEQFFKPAVTSARQFLKEAGRANRMLEAEFSAWRKRLGDNDNLAVEMARDFAQKTAARLPKAAWPPAMAAFLTRYEALEAKLKKANAAREKTMARERNRLIQAGRTYFEEVGFLHTEAHRQKVFEQHPALYLLHPSVMEHPGVKKRPIDPV